MSAERTRIRPALTAVIGILSLLSACVATGPTNTAGTRAKLYSSMSELAADSTDVVIGTVTSREVRFSDQDRHDPYTVLRLSVSFRPDIPVVARTYDGQRFKAKPQPGEEITVLQWGSPDVSSADIAILGQGVEYLLFLHPTELPEETIPGGSAWYYITGAGAGSYQANGDGFSRLNADGPDRLPGRTTTAELAKLR